MNIIGLVSLLMMMTLAPLIKSTESGEFYNYLELEKAQIRNKEPPKVSPGQIIAAVAPVTTTAAIIQERRVEETAAPKPTPTIEEKKVKPTQTASTDEKTKPKKEKPEGSSDGGKEKKKNSSQDQDEDDDINKLPKRLFRPRFRAESSAESISISSVLLTLAISLVTVLFI